MFVCKTSERHVCKRVANAAIKIMQDHLGYLNEDLICWHFFQFMFAVKKGYGISFEKVYGPTGCKKS